MQLPKTTKILNRFADTDLGTTFEAVGEIIGAIHRNTATAAHFETSQTTAIIVADVIFRRRNDTLRRLAGTKIIRLIEADIEDN